MKKESQKSDLHISKVSKMPYTEKCILSFSIRKGCPVNKIPYAVGKRFP